MNLWPVRWRKNIPTARADIGARYLSHLRWNLLCLPAPHIVRESSAEDQIELRDILAGKYRVKGALTMIGESRLLHLDHAVQCILKDDVPGDFLEAGAWRGGACIYLRALLEVFGCRNRIVWVADAFDGGFPKPDSRYPIDSDSRLHERDYFRTPCESVRRYFAYYGYDDAQVRLLPGYFKDTLPSAPIKSLALLRLDGDLYGSNWEPLDILYDKVSVGGYIIADDYQNIKHAQRAIDDFRTMRRVTAPLRRWDWASVYWVKESA